MDRLPIDPLPERGTFVVGECIEEGFAEGGVGISREGVVVGARGWGGGGTSAGAVVVPVVSVVRAAAVRALAGRCWGGGSVIFWRVGGGG